jgi:hypothetical protein
MTLVEKWIRAKRCAAGGCVEVAFKGDDVYIRSSHHPEAVLKLHGVEWEDFLIDAAAGEFRREGEHADQQDAALVTM